MSLLSFRTRRLRLNPAIRSMLQEQVIRPEMLVKPVFVHAEKHSIELEIIHNSKVFSQADLLFYLEQLLQKGVKAINLYPYIKKEDKDEIASHSVDPNSIIPRTIQTVKAHFPQLLVFPDVALDPYTIHGHDGLLDGQGNILNDESVNMLVRQSVLYAQAGADLVAPSDMFDGRTRAIRQGLDQAGFEYVGIIAYAAKFASGLYGPFRAALGNSGLVLDKRSYQLGIANSRQAVQRAVEDVEQGADIILVKPAGYYLDIVAKLREAVPCPIAAFHVSGENAMIRAAANLGLINEAEVVQEQLLSIKRAGADLIFTYYADFDF